MPDGSGHPAAGRIGPNALWQLLPLIERVGGRDLSSAMLAEAGIFEIPDLASGLIDEGPVARLHRGMREGMPDMAARLLREAGLRTADYILANRIPPAAQALLRVLPRRMSARLLAKAIARNAWTFAGSGEFRIESFDPLIFALANNPLIRGEHAETPLCDWHAAVFERLYRKLVSRTAEVTEIDCAARGGTVCRFRVTL